MSDKVLFDPTSDKWALSDGEHYLEVPYWAREIIADEFERETRQLNAENAALLEECDGWKKLCVDQEVMHVMHEDALDNEIAKLRELLQRLLAEYRYLRVRPRKAYLQHEGRMRAIEEEMRELGIEVDE